MQFLCSSASAMTTIIRNSYSITKQYPVVINDIKAYAIHKLFSLKVAINLDSRYLTFFSTTEVIGCDIIKVMLVTIPCES